nr:DMT family transporter [uncultured Gellertiella sp.]
MTAGKSGAGARRVPLVALLAGGVAIGGSPIFMRLSEVGPVATAFWRLGIGLLVLLAYAALFQRKALLPPGRAADLATLVLPGAFLASDLICWHLSVGMTSITNATLLINSSPVFVTFGAWALTGAPITRRFLLGLAVAIFGVVILKTEGAAGLGAGRWQGDLLAVAGAVFYAGYMLALGSARKDFGTLQVMLWNTTSAALCILPVALLREPVLAPSTLHGWAVVTGLSMISHVGGQAAIIYALAYLPAAFSSLTLLLQPVVATLLGVVVLGERVGLQAVIGGAFVLLGIFIARRGSAG